MARPWYQAKPPLPFDGFFACVATGVVDLLVVILAVLASLIRGTTGLTIFMAY